MKLIDSGSLVSDDPTKPRPLYNRFFGTIAYASPEITKDGPYQAPCAEVWALGVLLSFLLTGTSPISTDTERLNGNINYKRNNNASILWQRLSPECKHLLQ